MKIARLDRIVALSVLALASSAQAEFVLFGEHNPARYEQGHRFEFIPAVCNPYYADDAIIRSDLRFIYSSTRVDDNEAIGGNFDQFILQPHLAVTPQIEVGFNKLGFLTYHGDETGLVQDVYDDGMNDLGITAKYAFYQNYERQLFMAIGAGYELAIGDEEAMADDDEFRIFFAINKGQGGMHFGATANLVFTNGDDNGTTFTPQSGPSQDYAFGDSELSFIWSVNCDYYMGPYFSPVIQLSGFHGFDRQPDNQDDTIAAFTSPDPNASGPDDVIRPLDISMADNANMATGGDIYFASFGGVFRPFPNKVHNFGVHAAFEFPFRFGNSMETKFEYRLTFGLSYKF